MSFLEPLLLAGLPLVVLPIVIHLLNRRRYRTVAWGAMMFLLQAARKSRKQSRLRHLLILAARMLAIAALIFVIARPLASGFLSMFGGAPDTVIIVLDRSPSMEQRDLQTGRSKRSTAIDQVIDTLSKTGTPRHLVLIDSGTNIAHPMPSIDALRESPEILGTDGAADVPSMLQTALQYVTANESGRTDIWICSDLQTEDWNVDGGEWAAIREEFAKESRSVRFQILAYRRVDPLNLAVRVERLERIKSDDTDLLVLDIQVQGDREAPNRKFPLEIVIDGARSVAELSLQEGKATLKGYEIPLEGNRELGWGKLELPNDTNPRDNVFYFAYGPSIIWNTVVVSDQPDLVRPLALAAGPKIPAQPMTVSTVTSDSFSSVDLANVSFIIWHAPLPQGSMAARLESFVGEGGVCMFVPSRDESDVTFAGTRYDAWKQSPAEGPFRVDQWRDDSGLLQNVNSGQALPVGEIEVFAYRSIVGGGQPVARLANGDTLLSRVPTDTGGLYFLSTLPSLPESNLARQGIAMFAMVQRALAMGADRLATSRSVTVGTVSSDDATAWRSESAAVEGEEMTARRELLAGVYSTEGRLISTNRPATEDRVRPLDETQLEPILAGLDYHVVNDDVQGNSPLIREIWKLFAVLILIALLGEAFLCLPDLQPRPNPAPAVS